MHKHKLILNNCILGFYSGLPLLLLGSTLQAWYVEQGLSLIAVGALSLISLPHLFKFIWAPLLDRFKKGQKRKVWILSSQIVLALGLILIAMFEPKNNPSTMAIIALVIVFFSATQDIAVDAYRQVHTPCELRSRVVAGANISYRIAMLLSGGLALVFADNIGWENTYNIMALIMIVGAVYTLFLDDYTSSDVPLEEGLKEQIKHSLQHVMQDGMLYKIIVLFTLYKISDAFLLVFLQPFLLKGLNYSLSEVGVIVKVFGTVAIFLGTAFAGAYGHKISAHRGMLVVSVMQSFVMLLFVICSFFPVKEFVISAVFLESFTSGAASCMLVIFIMSLCGSRYAATQIAFFTAVAAIPRVLLGPICGYFVTALGWSDFFSLGFISSLPIIVILFKPDKVLFEPST